MRLTEARKELILHKTEPLYLPSKSFHFFFTASPSETIRKQEKKWTLQLKTSKKQKHKKTSKCENKNQRKQQTKNQQNKRQEKP